MTHVIPKEEWFTVEAFLFFGKDLHYALLRLKTEEGSRPVRIGIRNAYIKYTGGTLAVVSGESRFNKAPLWAELNLRTKSGRVAFK